MFLKPPQQGLKAVTQVFRLGLQMLVYSGFQKP